MREPVATPWARSRESLAAVMSYANDMPTTTRALPRADAASGPTRASGGTRATPELASSLRIGVMRLGRRLRAERADTGLTLTQLATLATLERLGPTSPGALAAHEKVRPPSMTRVLASLEAQGLIDRVDHPSDRRQVVVSITDSARALLRDDRRQREAWLSRRLAELSPEERAVLRAAAPILDRLATA